MSHKGNDHICFRGFLRPGAFFSAPHPSLEEQAAENFAGVAFLVAELNGPNHEFVEADAGFQCYSNDTTELGSS